MSRTIHTTQKERHVQASEAAVLAIKENTKNLKDLHEANRQDTRLGFTGVVKAVNKNNLSMAELHDSIHNPERVVSKLEEIKSAALITNQELKKIAKKNNSLSLEGISVITLKGDKGDKGETGNRGERGEKGDHGEAGKDGKNGKDGTNGKDADSKSLVDEILKKIPKGKDGYTPKKGMDYFDGEDVDEEKLKKAIIKEVIKEVLMKIPERVGDVMNQRGYSTGGANAIILKSNGTRLTDFYTDINFGSGLTASYSNGVVTLTGTGGGGFTELVATGTIDDSNVTFTFTSHPTYIVINGIWRKIGEGWSGAGTTITLTAPIGSGGSIYGVQ